MHFQFGQKGTEGSLQLSITLGLPQAVEVLNTRQIDVIFFVCKVAF